MSDHSWLPALVCLPDYGGDWGSYLEAVYRYFREDFISSRPVLRKRAVRVRREPVTAGREAGFWHLISEGRVEEERTPDVRRCERIRWPRPVIEAVVGGRVLCWSDSTRGDRRLLIAVGDFSYVVVLLDRAGHYLLLSAYPVRRHHRREKLRREAEKAGAAIAGGPRTPSTHGG